MDKRRRMLTTVPICVWWIADLMEKIKKKRGKRNG